jgi:ComF family protein
MIDGILKLFAPHYCLACEAEGDVLCPACMGMLQGFPSLCYRCGAATQNNATCKSCRPATHLCAVWAVTEYEGYAKDVIWKLKFGGSQAAAKDIAKAMVALEPEITPQTIISHVPTSSGHIRARGYDQARLLAREIAKQTEGSYVSCLARSGQHRQVGASRKQRFEQLTDALRPVSGIDFTDTHILLVDDVLTSGATLEAAARVLKQAGARRVDAIVFARA